MINFKRNHGFSLAEVVVSTAVIAFLMTSLFNYVAVAGAIWQKTHESITLSNESNVLLDTIEKELWENAQVSEPVVNATASSLLYNRRVSDYQTPPNFIQLDFEISYDDDTNTVSKALLNDSAFLFNKDWSDDNAASGILGSKKIVRGHHTYALARSVKKFKVTRLQNKLIEIDVLLGITDSEGNEKETRMKRTVLIR